MKYIFLFHRSELILMFVSCGLIKPLKRCYEVVAMIASSDRYGCVIVIVSGINKLCHNGLTLNRWIPTAWSLNRVFHVCCTHTPRIIDMHRGVRDHVTPLLWNLRSDAVAFFPQRHYQIQHAILAAGIVSKPTSTRSLGPEHPGMDDIYTHTDRSQMSIHAHWNAILITKFSRLNLHQTADPVCWVRLRCIESATWNCMAFYFAPPPSKQVRICHRYSTLIKRKGSSGRILHIFEQFFIAFHCPLSHLNGLKGCLDVPNVMLK